MTRRKILTTVILHTVTRRLSAYFGDRTIKSWTQLSLHEKARAIVMVENSFIIQNFTAQKAHAFWAQRKHVEGWRYGRRKYVKSKKHPGLMPWSMISGRQRVFHEIFADVINIVKELQ